MPRFTFSQALTASQLGYNPVSGWQYETIPYQWPAGAACKLMVNSTGVSARITVYSGSQTIQERSPVQAGGTAGVLPAELNVDPLVWRAGPGDRIKLAIDEVAAATPTVNGVIVVEPI